jgi:hypothetical protein
MKQTAVEWLVKKFMTENTTREGWHEIFEQAKEMEKDQIIEAYEQGYTEDIPYPVSGGYYRMNAEQYYNETFKK